MTDININRLMDNLRIRLPGSTDDLLRMELFNVLNDWFQDTNIWREEIAVPITAGVTDYELIPSEPSMIMRLVKVWDNSNQFPIPATLDTITRNLILTNKPSQDATYTAQVALTVDDPLDRDGYPVFPMWVLNTFQNDILDGVMGRMMSQAAKPWSNPALAVAHTRAFRVAVAVARAEAARKFTYNAEAWTFPQGFNRKKNKR